MYQQSTAEYEYGGGVGDQRTAGIVEDTFMEDKVAEAYYTVVVTEGEALTQNPDFADGTSPEEGHASGDKAETTDEDIDEGGNGSGESQETNGGSDSSGTSIPVRKGSILLLSVAGAGVILFC